MMGPGAAVGGKNLGSFMKSFAGNLGSQLGGMSGASMIGGPLSGIGLLQDLMGGNGAEGPDGEDNPGKKMFRGATNDNVGFLERFKEQLFKNSMSGFMGPRGY